MRCPQMELTIGGVKDKELKLIFVLLGLRPALIEKTYIYRLWCGRTVIFSMESCNEYSKVIIYITKIIYPKYNPFWFLFYMYIVYFRLIKRTLYYTLRPVQDTFILTHLKANPSCFCDINNTVLVNEHNLYQYDKLLKVFCPKTNGYRNVIVAPSLFCSKDVIMVSHTCYFNLISSGLTSSLKLTNFHEHLLRFADEIDISLIQSPHDINNSVIDSIIGSYFKVPKLIKKGDIIEINVKCFAKDIYFLNNKLTGLESVYFKCKKVLIKNEEVTEDCFCVIGETAIRQSVNIQSYVPQKRSKVVINWYESSNFKEVPLCPYGLQIYLDQITKSVRPFTKIRKLNLKPAFLLQGSRGCGKEILVSSLAFHLGMHFYKINNSELTANIYAQNETKIKNAFFNAKMAVPCIISIHNFENFGKNNEGQYDERIMGYFEHELDTLFENNPFPVILFCCSNEKNIHANLKKIFLETFEINAPDAKQREEMLEWILEERNVGSGTNLNDIANKTPGFYFEDLKALVYYAISNSKNVLSEAEKAMLSEENFTKAIDYMQSNYSQSIGAPKVPKIQWDDIGGLTDVKEEIIKTVNLPLRHPEFLKKSGLKRSGILLYGPPGTGKTLIAKAVATECNLCFLSVKGPELLNMYVGQSEQNIRDVFERARQASPCIIFFDELDSLAPNRGMSGDSGGVMDRVVSQLLAEMDGLNESATVFIVGATNRPDLIDPALLRPGRFDKLLFVGPCTDASSKIAVLKALTRKFKLQKDVDLLEVVRMCPPNITGADFYGICSNAWLSAVRKLIEAVQAGQLEADQINQEDVVVDFEDFSVAVANVKPSITSEDLEYFDKLKKELSGNNK
ncbi:hypothetical protein NQ318_000669 [Aromia moschata]|uniref:Peroxisomal ATPase PEX6 n=1 Tax=Aromia moschata TaxID=1265417 RepID=A0AAV8XC74_9CUCU|nr:hypothetical protein NQ318_000669 [Aromia moschata]